MAPGTRRALLPNIPSADDLGLVPATYEALERLGGLHARILSRLSALAEKAETAAGLPPAAAPKAVENRDGG